MSSQSAYANPSSPAGLGMLAVESHRDHLTLQPDYNGGGYTGGGSSAGASTAPNINWGSTGSTDPVASTQINPDGEVIPAERIQLFSVDGEYVIIAGRHRIKKSTLFMAGGGLLATALLLILLK
jgi:hypothetical protein